jgi:hypothetical protein
MREHLYARLGPVLSSARLVYGLSLIVRPEALIRPLSGQVDRASRTFARVLGLRQVAEAVVLRHHTGPRWATAGACVDGIHAATMVALAARGGHRRLAIANASVATVLTALGLLAAREARG